MRNNNTKITAAPQSTHPRQVQVSLRLVLFAWRERLRILMSYQSMTQRPTQRRKGCTYFLMAFYWHSIVFVQRRCWVQQETETQCSAWWAGQHYILTKLAHHRLCANGDCLIISGNCLQHPQHHFVTPPFNAKNQTQNVVVRVLWGSFVGDSGS